jgi:hypothetical protein
MSDEFESLIARLSPREDERVVVTVAAIRSGASWDGVFVSVLVGPAEMADVSWPTWYEYNQDEHLPIVDLLAFTSRPALSWAAFDYSVGGWRFVRFSLPVDELATFLNELSLRKRLGVPDADPIDLNWDTGLRPLRVLSHETTSVSRLISSAGRPVTGWYAPVTPHSGNPFAKRAHEATPFPETWSIEGTELVGAALFIAGFSTTETFRPEGIEHEPARPGILVGRVERQAWLGRMKGSADLATFVASVHRELDGPMLWDLELDLEERETSSLLGYRRLRLSDVDLPSVDAQVFEVAFPTLGPRLIRRILLADRDGNLLDGSDRFSLFEAGLGPNASVPDRLARMHLLEVQYASLLEGGVRGRVVAVGDDGVARVSDLLRAATDELLVFDPYFMKDDDWKVLGGVALPMRVLIGQQGVRPSAGVALASSSLLIRRWAGGGPPPFHDRAYLWGNGGIQVGTSPSGLGARLTLIDFLSPAMVAGLQVRFEAWWTSPDFANI